MADKRIAIVIHGGAGNVPAERLTEERKVRAMKKMNAALQAGYDILSAGGSALDAVEAAVRVMESSRWFNAGKGSTANTEGIVECDASIMTSSGGKAGACAGVHTVKHPITLARRVMENSPHVLLISEGAEHFARQQAESNKGVEIIDPHKWFYNMRKAKAPSSEPTLWDLNYRDPEEKKFGTVGCAALDQNGNLAAATSTGGTNQKLPGRVGDSPLIGAGTWADSNVAVSCTGKGEIFIRQCVAYDLAARMKYGGQSLDGAARELIQKEVPRMAGGEGGLIAVDKNGNVSLEFNTSCMFRGYIDAKGNRNVAILRD